MEPDRYKMNHPLYIIGMISLVISLSILLFFLFMLPHLLFGVVYDVPEFIFFWREILISNYQLSVQYSSWLILFILGLVTFIFGMIACYASVHIDNCIHDEKTGSEKTKNVLPRSFDTLLMLLKLSSVLILVYFLIMALEWLMVRI